MKNFLFFLFFCLVCASAFSAEKSSNDKLVLGFNNYPPYHYLDENREPQGMVIEIANEVFKRIKKEVKYIQYPWTRCLASAKSGITHGVLFLFHKKERESFIHYDKNNVIGYEVNAFFSRKGSSFKYSGDSSKLIKELKGRKIGVVKDFSYGKNFDKIADQLDLHKSYDPKDLLRLLLLERYDLIVHNELVVAWQAKLMSSSEKLNKIQPILSKDAGYIGFSKLSTSSELAAEFGRALKQFKETDHYLSILKKYSMTP